MWTQQKSCGPRIYTMWTQNIHHVDPEYIPCGSKIYIMLTQNIVHVDRQNIEVDPKHISCGSAFGFHVDLHVRSDLGHSNDIRSWPDIQFYHIQLI